jgi:[ribosomal protein S5]-alanine N-acetyltransferase
VSTFPWVEGIPELVGDIVRVREVRWADGPALFELLSDPAVAAHMSAPPPSVAAFAGFIVWAREQRARGESVCFGIVPPDAESAVGIIQVRALEPTFFTAEWGFAIGHLFWGTGAFVEAALLVAKYAFETMHVHRLEARATVDNGRGNGALQKIGARPEGELKSAFRREDRRDRQFLWSLAAEDLHAPARLHARFSPADAACAIRAAVASAQRAICARRPEPHIPEPPPLHPFFVTQPEK